MTEFPWVARGRESARMQREFMAVFMQGTLMANAQMGRWAWALERYAKDCAKVQADLTAGVANTGYTSAVYDWGDSPPPQEARRRRRSFEDFCSLQAATGKVAVEVPQEAVEAWRSRAK